MSEELLQEKEAQTETVINEPDAGTTEASSAAEETLTAETMADYEEHFDDANPWNVVKRYMEEKTRLPIKIEGIVNGGAIAMVEGLRGFIPASRLSLSYIENLEDYLLKELTVIVIDVNEAENRFVLSAREILKEEEMAAKCRRQSRKRYEGRGRQPSKLRRVYQSGRRTFRTCSCVPD